MKWQLGFSSQSLKFLERNNIQEELIVNEVVLALKKFQGEESNVDIKKLKGEWDGFYRIRSGRLRIILEFAFDEHTVTIEAVDWRGNLYK